MGMAGLKTSVHLESVGSRKHVSVHKDLFSGLVLMDKKRPEPYYLPAGPFDLRLRTAKTVSVGNASG